jgi:cyanophycin synthetase
VDQIFGVSKKKLIKCDWIWRKWNNFNKIDGFKKNRSNVTTLIEHRCSEGCRGDFFQSGTRYLDGACNEHIALEIQTLAGMDTGFGRTRETKTLGTYNVVFSYTEERWPFRQNQPLRLPNPNRGN